MKFKISYLPAEEPEAARSLAALRELHPKAKVRRVSDKPPRKLIYLSTPEPKKPCKQNGCMI